MCGDHMNTVVLIQFFSLCESGIVILVLLCVVSGIIVKARQSMLPHRLTINYNYVRYLYSAPYNNGRGHFTGERRSLI